MNRRRGARTGAGSTAAGPDRVDFEPCLGVDRTWPSDQIGCRRAVDEPPQCNAVAPSHRAVHQPSLRAPTIAGRPTSGNSVRSPGATVRRRIVHTLSNGPRSTAGLTGRTSTPLLRLASAWHPDGMPPCSSLFARLALFAAACGPTSSAGSDMTGEAGATGSSNTTSSIPTITGEAEATGSSNTTSSEPTTTIDTAPEPACIPGPGCCDHADCQPVERCEFGECVLVGELLPACPPEPSRGFVVEFVGTLGGLVLVDIDGDLDLDIVTVQPGVVPPRVDLLQAALNDGAGAFTVSEPLPLGPPTSLISLAAGDLDGDGDPDLVVARPLAKELRLLRNQAGSFVADAPLPALNPTALFAGHFDADPSLDILMVRADDAVLAVWHGDGMGGLSLVEGLDAPAIGRGVSVLDLDLDGLDDIVSTPPPGDDQFLIYSGRPDGVPETLAQLFLGPGNPSFAQAADLDGSAGPEIVATLRPSSGGGSLAVWRATTPGSWEVAPIRLATTTALQGGSFADLDGDAVPDLVSAATTATLAVLPGDGAGGFACERIHELKLPALPNVLAIGDIDGDSHLDIVAGSHDGPTVTVLRTP